MTPIAIPPHSTLNTFGLVFTAAVCLLTWILPRRCALAPLIILICYMTMGQDVVVEGLNFNAFRIVTLAGWVRVIVRRDFRRIHLNSIDKTTICFVIANLVAYTLLWRDYDSFKYKLGLAYDVIGVFFLFRIFMENMDDVVRVFKIAAILVLPLSTSMLYEKLTGTNFFAVFGGVHPITQIRDGVLRCEGPFAHPILAGTFGATLMPLFVALWIRAENRLLASLAIIGSLVITWASGSSGPVLILLCGIMVLCMWPLRMKMRTVRWGILLMLTALELVMKSPVWFLIARVDIFSGSTGYHRAMLIDGAIKHLSEWWLIGTKTTLYWANPGQRLFDVTNQYLVYGADGGLVTMFLFIGIIVFCFAACGRTVRAMEGARRRADQWTVWSLGAAVFAHTINYLSVSYFDQTKFAWYLLVAMICGATTPLLLEDKSQDQFSEFPCTANLVLQTNDLSAMHLSSDLGSRLNTTQRARPHGQS